MARNMEPSSSNTQDRDTGGPATSLELKAEDVTVVGKKIGSGHTSNVFRGRLRDLEVAVKQLSVRKLNTRSFSREVAIMSQMQHPNIVRMFGIVLESLPFKVVMEYCAGGNAFELIHNKLEVQLSWPQRLRMCRHTAAAMDYLHNFDPQIIHRDLKSLNLLLDQPVSSDTDRVIVKVSDFGLSRMLEVDQEGSHQMTTGVGTSYWMAPEIFISNAYDAKVDVYSYGMVIYEIICRRIPFEELEIWKLQGAVLAGKTPDLEPLPPEVPAELPDLAKTCWAFDPAARPTFGEILRILRFTRPVGEDSAVSL